MSRNVNVSTLQRLIRRERAASMRWLKAEGFVTQRSTQKHPTFTDEGWDFVLFQIWQSLGRPGWPGIREDSR